MHLKTFRIPDWLAGQKVLEGRRQQIEAKVRRNREEQEESLRRREELLQVLEVERETRRQEREQEEEQRTTRVQELDAQVHARTHARTVIADHYTNVILWPTTRLTNSYSG